MVYGRWSDAGSTSSHRPFAIALSHQPLAMAVSLNGYGSIEGSPYMQPSALRALEFDRIVEAVTGFALTPMGAERLSQLAPSTDPAAGRPIAGGDDRNRAVRHRARPLPVARVERAAAGPRGPRRRRTGARIAPAARAGDVSRLDRRVARRASAAHPDPSRCSSRPSRARRRSRESRPRYARRSTRRARSSTMPAPSCG